MSDVIKLKLCLLHQLVDDQLHGIEPSKLILVTAATSLALVVGYTQINGQISLRERSKRVLFRWVNRIPAVRKRIGEEAKKVRETFERDHMSHHEHIEDNNELPKKGNPVDEVARLAKTHLHLGTGDWKEGKHSGALYIGDEELNDVVRTVYKLTAWSNPLHPDAFPGVRKMEAEIVRICCNLFNGGPDSCGTVTSCGTESLLLACKAYRDYAQQVKGIQNPVMVVPVTAHAGFDKAASLLNIAIQHVEVDPVTFRVDLKAMRRAVSGSTCMLVGSAPQFPHGSMDDIVEIAQMGLEYDIPVHVDACLGGFLIAFMNDAGYPLKPFDFSVPGVTSISADTHKYGLTPKGSSVVLYSEPKYRHYQWFCTTDWPGGIYATSTIGGSRSGAVVATCWATLVYFGKSGYVEATRKVVQTTRYLCEEIKKIDGIQIIGSPDVSIIAMKSELFNIYGLADHLKKRGWNLNMLQYPASIHICVTLLHSRPGAADKFIVDLREMTNLCLQDPRSCDKGSAAIYGLAQSLPDRSIVDKLAWTYLDSLYITGNKTTKKQ